MDDIDYVVLSDISEINSPTDMHRLDDNTFVSFIPMADVSESGEWINQQARPLKDVRNGYTCFQEGDILFAKITPCMENGKGAHAVNLLNGIGFGTTEFHVLRAKSRAHPRFIYHWIMNEELRRKAEARMTGSAGQRRVPASFLGEFKVPFPPLPEQHRIAEILDTIDEVIQKTEALISKLKVMKQGLLHDLLTRGLDKNGKLRDPKAHPEQFKDSPLGSLPKEWVIQELGKAAPKIQDGTHFSPKTTSGSFRYLTSKNIRFGYVDLSDCGWISKKEHEAIYSRCDVRYGDVLLTKDGANTGNAAINNLNEPVSLLSSVAFIRCDDRTLHSEYVFHYLLSPGCQQRIKDLMSGNAITRLTLERIKSFVIPVPDIKEQLKIIEPLNSHDARIRAEEQYRYKLKLQKKGLMHDLLTGKVRVEVV